MASFKRQPRSGGNGGGYLHGVTGRIDSIGFKAGTTGEGKNGPWTKYSLVVEITPDGSKTVPQFLDAGFLPRGLSISDDGASITGTGSYYLDPDTEAGRFIFSMEEGEGNKLTEEQLGDGRSYAHLAGIRVTFARVRDEQGTIDAGLRKLKIKSVTDENRDRVIEAGKRVDKKDASKKYWRDNLLVAEVVAMPEAKKGGAAKKATAAKATAPAADVDLTADADAALKEILSAAPDNTVAREKLSNLVLRYAVKKNLGDKREPLRVFVASDAYLADAQERGVIVLDGEGKSQQVIAA